MHPFFLKKKDILKTFQQNIPQTCIFYSLTHQILCLVIRGVTYFYKNLLFLLTCPHFKKINLHASVYITML